jgi:hypothetical protein
MRLLVFLLLFSCSHTPNLKYKYTSAKRYLASLTKDDVKVTKLVGELKHPVLFASGMDSTTLVVKLYDSEGNLLTDVDPSDLTLSTSEDIEAKPFVVKQGVYKTVLLPRLKSKSIRMRVDWKEQAYSQEIILETTLSPLKDELDLLSRHAFQTPRLIDGVLGSEPTDGFSLDNVGDNKIVRIGKFPHSQRVFNFDYPEQARQNLSMEVYDAPNETVSHTMHSIFWIFPRNNMFLAQQLTGTIDVTLPNGEKLIFNRETKEIIGGVFEEGPVDYSKDRHKRMYPDLKYTGRGVVLRVNGRGSSPQLGEFEKNKIDLDYGKEGAAEVLIMNGTTGEKCRRPKSDFWEPIDVSPIVFKFSNDEDFDIYLRNYCGFGLPKF